MARLTWEHWSVVPQCLMVHNIRWCAVVTPTKCCIPPLVHTGRLHQSAVGGGGEGGIISHLHDLSDNNKIALILKLITTLCFVSPWLGCVMVKGHKWMSGCCVAVMSDGCVVSPYLVVCNILFM